METGQIVIVSFLGCYFLWRIAGICYKIIAAVYSPNWGYWWCLCDYEPRIWHDLTYTTRNLLKAEIEPLKDEKVYWRGYPCCKWCWLRWWNIFLLGLVFLMTLMYIKFEVQNIELYLYFILPPILTLGYNIFDVVFYEYVLTNKRIIVYNHLWRKSCQYDLVSYLKLQKGSMGHRQVWQASGCYDLCMLVSMRKDAQNTLRVFFYSISASDVSKIKDAIVRIRSLHNVPRPLPGVSYIPPAESKSASAEQCPSWLRGVVESDTESRPKP